MSLSIYTRVHRHTYEGITFKATYVYMTKTEVSLIYSKILYIYIYKYIYIIKIYISADMEEQLSANDS